jgi:nucleoside-diphosphate-sugar epimerase
MRNFALTDKPKSRACVTGASGLIGRRIVQRLLTLGYEVRVLSRKKELTISQVTLFCGGLEDEAVLADFLRGAHLLFHCAAELQDQSRMWEVNVAGTERLLRLAAQEGIEYLCHLSSAGVVGKTRQLWVDEETPCRPQSPYERSKWEAEKLAARMGGGSRTVILRPTNVIGPGQPGALGLPGRAAWADRLKVWVTGGECAHIVHAEDVAAAAVFFITYPLSVQVFLVSCDHEPLNTMAGLWTLYHACRDHRPLDGLKPAAHLPLVIPYLLRRLRGRGSNRGDVRYASQRLLATGFSLPLGLVGAVQQVLRDQETAAT